MKGVNKLNIVECVSLILYICQECNSLNIMEPVKDYLVTETYSLFMEKSEWKERRDAWMKKYKYEPISKIKGTIEVDGNKYTVIWGNTNPAGKNIYNYNPSKNLDNFKGNTAGNNRYIMLPRDVFRYKNTNDINYATLHEVGHIKLRNDKQPTPYTYMNPTQIGIKKRSNADKERFNFNDATRKFGAEDKYYSYKGYKYDPKFPYVPKPSHRKDIKDKTSDHPNTSEFEADAFAADHLLHNTSDAVKGIKRIYNASNKLSSSLLSGKRDKRLIQNKITKILKAAANHTKLEDDTSMYNYAASHGSINSDGTINKARLIKALKGEMYKANRSIAGTNNSINRTNDIHKTKQQNDIKERIRALNKAKQDGINTKLFTK